MSIDTTKTHWQDDLLQRKEAATFLQNVIDRRSRDEKNQNSICMAIDGDWGTGKSFFIENWSKSLIEEDRCVIFFDAWKNDLSDDPLIGFMSEINKSLKPWLDLIAADPKVSIAIKNKAKFLLKNAAKALVPFGKQMLIHTAAKFVSTEGIEIAKSAFGGEKGESDFKFEVKPEEIEKYFSAALKGHEMQNASIEKLIESLEALADGLMFLNKTTPIYIFIDELDRCRPTYAIRLLEGIKHIFNAKGICFVLATNIDQLSHSIKAVYGESFNGRAYLKRFIDYEYKLNSPDNYSFCTNLFSKSFLSNHPHLFSGIVDDGKQDGAPDVLADIANVFELDLRSISQIFGQIEAAIASIGESDEIHCLYMFALAAIMHKNPKIIDELCRENLKKIPNLDTIMNGSGREFIEIFRTDRISERTTKTTTIKELIVFYQYILTDLEQNEMNNIYNEYSTYRRQILQRTYAFKRVHQQIKNYPHLLRMAGSLESN